MEVLGFEEPEGWEEWEPGDEGGWDDPGRSYGLFFLSRQGEGFQFQIEGEFLDEAADGVLVGRQEDAPLTVEDALFFHSL